MDAGREGYQRYNTEWHVVLSTALALGESVRWTQGLHVCRRL